MKLYIAVWYHKHGEDVVPLFAEQEPSQEDAVEALKRGGNFFEERDREALESGDEGIDIRGPFDLPAS